MRSTSGRPAAPGAVPSASVTELSCEIEGAIRPWSLVEIGRICQPSRLGILAPGATLPPCFPYQETGSHRGKDPER